MVLCRAARTRGDRARTAPPAPLRAPPRAPSTPLVVLRFLPLLLLLLLLLLVVLPPPSLSRPSFRSASTLSRYGALAGVAEAADATFAGGGASSSASSRAPAAEVEEGFEHVTYHSIVKLQHVGTGYRLHSHDLPYGSGSQQQSVTAYVSGQDNGGFWLVKGAHTRRGAERRNASLAPHPGQPVRCGDVVRLEHVVTRQNLHSHHEQSPRSGQQEVSAFSVRARTNHGGGAESGDINDDWRIECAESRGTAAAPAAAATGASWWWSSSSSSIVDGEHWMRDSPVYLRHVETGEMYLSSQKQLELGEPIVGQLEVSCRRKRSRDEQWRAAEGYFLAPAATATKAPDTGATQA